MRSGRFLTVFLLALVLLPGSPAMAQDTTVLGETVVRDRSPEARAAAMPAALSNALRRLTPADDAVAQIDLAAALPEGNALVQRYDYAQAIKPTASGIPSIKLMLRVYFAQVPVRELLVRAGQPVWRGGEVRPTLWLVDEGDDGRRLLEGRSEPALQALDERLRQRGVRLQWALNDLADWQMAEALTADNAGAAIAAAAQRGAVASALLAWVKHGAEGTGIDWYLHADDGSEAQHFASSGGDLTQALDNGAPRLVALLADSQAVRPAAVAAASRQIDRGPGEYVIWLENLSRADVYAEATALLQGQSVVAALTPEQAADDRVRVRVRLNAPLGQLLALLAADGRLLPGATPPGDADLTLRWRD